MDVVSNVVYLIVGLFGFYIFVLFVLFVWEGIDRKLVVRM